MEYSKRVFEHFQKPKFAGELKDADAVGEEGNIKCGDVMKMYIKVENNVIKDIRFKTYGCIAAIAASDTLCELAKGKTLEEAEKLTYADIIKEIEELPAIKIHCSVLGIAALRNAIKNYRKSN
ncbi:MAG: iron-sulfur cluster assembly scaffold protein [Candidatus Woesearchaeota archaeon]|nr:MAG: iron-sulfur cluster assembly scaffold protein [Candidatus Woesearchaeota archaeon]